MCARQHNVVEVACYATDDPRGHQWGAPTPVYGGSAHPISDIELTKTEVVEELSLAKCLKARRKLFRIDCQRFVRIASASAVSAI